jgi:PPOX class probable FMN-dependent enzyme
MNLSEFIRTERELRAVVGEPMLRSVKKQIARLDEHCRAFIACSPFVLVASCDAQGRLDVSPKGDPAGFVQVLDEHTLAIPDRPGNQRADTFSNVLQNPRVGLLFLIPGMQETLRVNGRASIVRDLALRERMALRGRVPALALIVTVEEAFIHCTKCMLRSQLWEPHAWPDLRGVPTQARFLVDHAQLGETLEEVQASLDSNRRSRLY